MDKKKEEVRRIKVGDKKYKVGTSEKSFMVYMEQTLGKVTNESICGTKKKSFHKKGGTVVAETIVIKDKLMEKMVVEKMNIKKNDICITLAFTWNNKLPGYQITGSPI